MSRKLIIADNVSLPLDAATQTFIVFGKRGSGKSTTGTRMAEQMIRADIPIAVLDPVDVWWGLKSGADGKAEGGLEVYVFGGDHSDLPLEPTAGELMADLLVNERVNVVMCLRQFSNREKARFVGDFADRLYKKNREVMHLFCEEAHEFMPQNPYKGEEEMLGRMLRLEKSGRTCGIGMTAITQRPPALSKTATTQGEVLVQHRVKGPQDIEAFRLWVKYNQEEARIDQVMESLASLKIGEGWIWSPGWPEDKPIDLRRFRTLMPETFDSRATPKIGERPRAPKSKVEVDLAKLGERMQATRERAKAEDPKTLHARIRELEKQLQTANATIDDESIRIEHEKIEQLEKEIDQLTKLRIPPALKEADLKRLEVVAGKFERQVEVAKEWAAQAAEIVKLGRDALASRPVISPRLPPPRRSPAPVQARARATITKPEGNGELKLNRGMRDILAALAQLRRPLTRRQVATLARLSPESGTFSNYLSSLATNGYIERLDDGTIRMSPGMSYGDAEAEPLTRERLKQLWLDKLGGGAKRMLEVLLAQYPEGLTRSGLAEATEMSGESGTFSNYLSTLRTNGLIDDRGGLIFAGATFFEV